MFNPVLAIAAGVLLATSLFSRKAGKDSNARDSQSGRSEVGGDFVDRHGGGLPGGFPAEEHHRGVSAEPAPEPVTVPEPVQPPAPAPGTATTTATGAGADQPPETPGKTEAE